jgi:hypothetical protein
MKKGRAVRIIERPRERRELLPLSDNEQRILEEIEKRLQEEDPRLAHAVSRTSLHHHVSSRIRWGGVAFLAGFVMLMMFAVSAWLAIAGFGVMLVSSLFVYQQIRRMSGEQIRAYGRSGRFSGLVARVTERFRGGRREPPASER